ncbi:hypothetical protein ABZY42_31565 [Streptomyces sp. NPDC006622]|uniref:hypothetical protein n=1 Tax=Streptomyces sp. NPDC006622 TaxID=3155459 RepID=UPI0033A46FE3
MFRQETRRPWTAPAPCASRVTGLLADAPGGRSGRRVLGDPADASPAILWTPPATQ